MYATRGYPKADIGPHWETLLSQLSLSLLRERERERERERDGRKEKET